MTNKRLVKLLMGHCGMSRDAARLLHREAMGFRTTNREIYYSTALFLSVYVELHSNRKYTVVHARKIPGDIMFRFKYSD
jgi:hypothetical protein|nr:MAG TPA: hypothetical protein [Caudoviricetes sp.]